MTVIAVRDGVMASDSLVTGNRIKYEAPKLYRRGDLIIGAGGNTDDSETLMEWFLQDPKDRPPLPAYRLFKDEEPSATLLVLRPDGAFSLVYTNGYSSDETAGRGFSAIGTGAVAAMAAMEMGADACKAVEIAIRIDPDCGGAIQTMRFK